MGDSALWGLLAFGFMLVVIDRIGTSREEAVLQLLADSGGWVCSLDIVKRLGRWKGGGSVYMTLASLEERGLVASRNDPGGSERGHRPRRLYRITDAGRKCLTS